MTPEIELYIESHAARLGLDPVALKAVLHVESSNTGFEDGLVSIRWEGHYFWRMLPTELRDTARSKGLADPRAQKIRNPSLMRDRHALLDRAAKIHAEAAYKSISMGAGQVMGAHAERLGYRDVFEMWGSAHTMEGQIDHVVLYIERFGLVEELKCLDWAGFARGYNGPNYQKFSYDTKLQDTYRQLGGTGLPSEGPSIRMGDRRVERVKALQERLSNLGHHLQVDGDFGPLTKRGVQAFQLEYGLPPSGVVDTATQGALDAAIPRVEQTPRALTKKSELITRSRIASDSQTLRNTGVVVAGAAGVAQTGAACLKTRHCCSL